MKKKSIKQKKVAPKSINRRISVAPEGGVLAEYGLYTKQVQAVVRNWEGKVERAELEEYFKVVARAVHSNQVLDVNLHFRVVSPDHWRLVFELGKAISEVLSDNTNIDKWLLTLPISVSTNGQCDSWDAIAESIGKRVGQSRASGFADKVKMRAKRLRILTPPHIAAGFRAVTKRPA